MAPGSEDAADAKIVPGSVVTGDDAATGDADGDDTASDDATGNDEAAGYDETSGIVYEVQPRGLEIFGLKDENADDKAPAPAGPGSETPAASETPATSETLAAGEPPTVEQTAVADIPPLSEALSPSPPDGGTRSHVFNPTPASADPAAIAAARPEQAGRPEQGARESRDNPFWRVFGRAGDGAQPADGDPPLTRFRDLPLDQKMHFWRIRALIVVIVGVLFSLIVSWQVGLTLAIIAGIADTVYRARTVESHAWPQAGTVDRATFRAQRRTIKQLAAMERAGYRSLHRRPIPDSEEVIDHLVVGPTGVYAIDSEKWNRELPLRQSNGKKLWLGPENKNERLDHATWEAGQASERLSTKLGMEVTVQPTLAIYGPKISWVVLNVRGVDVFAGDELKQYLKRRARRKGLPRLTHEEIRKIYEAAGGVLPVEWQNTEAPVG